MKTPILHKVLWLEIAEVWNGLANRPMDAPEPWEAAA
jgi:hypothetical protein